MKKIIEKQLLRAGLVTKQSKINEEDDNKQDGKKEGVEEAVSSIQTAVTDSLDNTASIIARSIIANEFAMVIFRKLVAEKPINDNFITAMLANLLAVGKRNELEEQYGKQFADQKIAEIVERAKKEVESEMWGKE